MSSTTMQSLTFTTFMVSHKIQMLKVFNKPTHLTDQIHINHLPWTHTRVTQFILCMIFFMNVATILHLNYSGQERKKEVNKHTLQFIFLTHRWPRNSHHTCNENVYPSHGHNHVKFERSHSYLGIKWSIENKHSHHSKTHKQENDEARAHEQEKTKQGHTNRKMTKQGHTNRKMTKQGHTNRKMTKQGLLT